MKINHCPNCGANLEKDYKFCPECAYSLKDSGSPSSSQNRIKVSNNNKSVKKAGSLNQTTSEPVKEISTYKVVGLFVGIIAFIFIILYFSGTFDTPQLPPQVQEHVHDNNSSGVDLNAMNQIQNMESQVKSNPGNDQLLLQLAHMKNDAGLPEQAIINYKEYLAKNPKDADARVDMAVCYYVLKNYDTAISEMELALKYQPDHQIAHMNLGIVNIAANKIDKGKEWLKKAVDLNPNSEVGKKALELLNSH